MTRRYQFLPKEAVYEALNKLRAAFLAARDGSEVEEIIKGVLTSDERIKIGRRIVTAQLLEGQFTYDQIRDILKVGRQTIVQTQKAKDQHPKCFELINRREEKVEDTYHEKAYRMTRSPKRFQSFPEYTGYKRKDVER